MLSERDTQIQRLEAKAAAEKLFTDWRKEHRGKRGQPKPAQLAAPTAAPDTAPPVPPTPSGDY